MIAANRMIAPAIVDAYVGVGSNLGDSAASIASALTAIQILPSTLSAKISPIYRSAPLDADGRDYLNAVIALATTLDAFSLLDALQIIERAQGRERPYPNAPRTLDLDLLLYGDAQIAHPRLTVPHPQMHQRAFVLRPLSDLAATLAIPALATVSELLKRCTDQRIERVIEDAP